MDKITIVKIGGKIINEQKMLIDFLQAFSRIAGKKILVHGGGRAATEMLKSLNIEPKMLDGRRITDQATLDVCIGQYAGNINKQIVGLLQSIDIDALGLSGADGGIIQASKRPTEPIDYGYAGDIEHVNAEKIMSLMELGFVPVLCAITADKQGQLLNTNADTIASEVSVKLAEIADIDLRYCFEYMGVLSDLQTETVIEKIEFGNFERLKQQGILAGGVIPKVFNAISAKYNGVNQVTICGIHNLVDLKNSTSIL